MSDAGSATTVTVLAYAPDLMDRSRLSSAAAAAAPPLELRFAADGQALLAGAAGADVAVVDLARSDALDVLASLAVAVPVVAFGSHVDRERLDSARAAGCRLVLARSRFFADVTGALTAVRSSG